MPSHKLAIMQPYFLPYTGYFQLLHAVDLFIYFDDVTYINKGWINRNRLLLNMSPWLFSVPLKNASQNILIKDLIVADNIDLWKEKFLKTISMAYKKALNFQKTLELLEIILSNKSPLFIDWLADSISRIAHMIKLPTSFKFSSQIDYDRSLKAQNKILSICEKEKATHYINPINGQVLYDKCIFSSHGIELSFLVSHCSYKQFKEPFIANLSIIDFLMFNDPAICYQSLASQYTLK